MSAGHGMSFRMFGVNVEVQMSFWITTVMFGLVGSHGLDPRTTLVWVAVVFVSILVHEFGHALAVMRHGIEPEIILYGMGGLTRYHTPIPLRRRDHVVISLAGPFAGFALGGVVVAAMRLAPGFFARLPMLGDVAVGDLLWVNFGWGIVNLMPVLPFDGGHVLEQTLGPKRTRTTSIISMVVAILIAAFFAYLRSIWGAALFGLSALQSYRRFASEAGPRPISSAPSSGDGMPPEISALLRSAYNALAEEDFARAASIAQRVLEGDGGAFKPPPPARREALEILAWTHLLEERLGVAVEILGEARKLGTPDPALEGAVLFAQRDFSAARKVLEAARAKGDERKQIIGPLVQILIQQNEVARAADVAFSVIESLSDEDARRMAELAGEHRAFANAARLWEAVFDRNHQPEDAYEAARAAAQGGHPDRALDLLRRAVDAGFSDRARAWSDAALAPLRGSPGLETVLPRP